MWTRAMEQNHRNMMSLMENNASAKFLDLGCDDGVVTAKLSRPVGTKDLYGIDIVDDKFDIAVGNGGCELPFRHHRHFSCETGRSAVP